MRLWVVGAHRTNKEECNTGMGEGGLAGKG